MPDLVLLKCDIGSKAAVILCPECGRISRQILSDAFSPTRIARLFWPHICPVCEVQYQNCDPRQAGVWSTAFANYNRNADEHNHAAKENYAQRKAAASSQPQHVSEPVKEEKEAPVSRELSKMEEVNKNPPCYSRSDFRYSTCRRRASFECGCSAGAFFRK